VARYLELGTDLARRILAGDLAAGAELPAIRGCAQTYATTSSTVARAYRYLADAGAITLADRRRARVATNGAIAAARLLQPDRVFRLAGSDDPALQLLLDHVGPAVTTVGTRGSFQGLRALVRGAADGAAIHLRDRDGTYNAPFATALLRHRQPRLLRLWRREQGLLVPPGNPHAITGPTDLATLRVAKREMGAGTRVLLEQILAEHDIAPHTVHGPELHSHLETALAIAAGIADVAIGPRPTATELGLEFLPLTWEHYDIALPADALGAAQPLLTALADPKIRTAITKLGGYDLAPAGELHPLDTTS
jgi:molybdate-binding protein